MAKKEKENEESKCLRNHQTAQKLSDLFFLIFLILFITVCKVVKITRSLKPRRILPCNKMA